MKLSFGQRMQSVIDNAGGLKPLASKTGMTAATFRNYVQGINAPSRDKIMIICECTNTSVAWFVAGEGAMDDRPLTEEESDLIKHIRKSGDKNLIARIMEEL